MPVVGARSLGRQGCFPLDGRRRNARIGALGLDVSGAAPGRSGCASGAQSAAPLARQALTFSPAIFYPVRLRLRPDSPVSSGAGAVFHAVRYRYQPGRDTALAPGPQPCASVPADPCAVVSAPRHEWRAARSAPRPPRGRRAPACRAAVLAPPSPLAGGGAPVYTKSGPPCQAGALGADGGGARAGGRGELLFVQQAAGRARS